LTTTFVTPAEAPVPDQNAGLLALIRSDIRRKQEHYVLVNRFFNKWIKIGMQHGTLAVVVYRFGHWALTRKSALTRALFGAIYRLWALPVTWLSNVYINPRTPIGSGFVIHNFSTVFIDAVSIGENFTINQGVTVGPDYKHDGVPTLGDNVFLGAGAVVLGKVTLGNNVVVAANALVGRSIAGSSVVAGVPGIVVMKNIAADYVGSVPAHMK
jgi:serine O-acetyltransferase